MPMTKIVGRNTFVSIDGTDISNAISDSTLAQMKEKLEAPAYGDTSKVYLPGLKDGSFNFSGYHTTDASLALDTAFGNDTAVIVYGIEGNAAGKPKKTFTVMIDNYEETAPVSGILGMSCTMTIIGDVASSTF